MFLNRMTLNPSNINLPFTMERMQFSVKPAFSFTINKSQGQTLNNVVLWLTDHVFTHGQQSFIFKGS